MKDIQHIRRASDAAPTIPSLLGLFNFDPIQPAFGAATNASKAAKMRLMIDGKPSDDVMHQLKRIFGDKEFDATQAADKLRRPRQSISDVLRAAVNHGLLTRHVTKPLGTIYYRIVS